SFVKTSAAEVNGFARRQLVISGTKGTIELRPLEAASENGRKAYGCYTALDRSDTWSDCSEKWESEEYDRLDAMMADFAALVRGEYENPYDHEYEIALHGLVMRCCGAEKRS
ncbi:MAG: hypothetical protein IK035_00755, partial [Firmicutes bacterium]|nr:hypothetical protein [Bacillota bacterium]